MSGDALRPTARKAALILAFFASGVFLFAFGSELDLGPLALTLCALFGVYVFVTHALTGRNFSLLDPGIFFGFVVLVYTAIPVGAFAAIGLVLSSLADNRLLALNITADDVNLVARTSIAAFVGFGVAYLATRKFEAVAPPARRRVDPLPLGIALALSCTILLVLKLYMAQTGKSYADEYVFYRGLPVLLVQFINVNAQFFVLSTFAIVYCLLAEKRLLACAGVLAAAISVAAFTSGSRTNLFLLILGSAFLYDRAYARIKLRLVLPAAVIGLFLFLVLGIFRFGFSPNISIGAVNTNFAERFSTGSEFMAIFATDLDILNQKREGLTRSAIPQVYYSDLAKLIPQQAMPFDKFDPASWYVTTFYPQTAERGGGFAFGMTAEALLGSGTYDALVRGTLLGLLTAFAFNYAAGRQRGIWKEVFAAWLFVNLYQGFRDSTFTILPRGLYQFLPALLLVMGASALIRAAGKNMAAPRLAGPPAIAAPGPAGE